MPLPIDFKIDKTIKRIQKELKEELNEEVSYDAIYAMLNFQIKSTINGMAEGHTVVLKYLGNFVATQKRVDMLNKFYIKKGKTPTLVDTGYQRVALTRKGIVIGESEFTPTSNKDLIYKP